jgi:DNA polymerase V
MRSNLYTGIVSSTAPDSNQPVRLGRDRGTNAAFSRASVAIGFGSPAGDTGVTRLDLNDILVRHPQATYLMRIAGGAMHELGIDAGDLVLIDRAIAPTHGHVVIAVVGEEFVCRQLSRQADGIRLQVAGSEGGISADIVAREGTQLEEIQIWGVVTQVIKAMPV